MINYSSKEILNPIWKARLALAGGIIALTLSPMFFRWSEAPGIVTSFYRMAITSLILIPLWLIFKPNKNQLQWKYLIIPILGGTASALDHGIWGTAINMTSVANATLLNNVSPLWVALIAWIFLKEKMGKSFWIGLIGVLIGAIMVLGSSFISKPEFLFGDFLAIVSSVFYALFFIATSKGRAFFSTLQYLLIMTITAALWLFLGTLLFDYSLGGYSSQTNLVFLLSALINQLGAYFLISYSLGNLSASVVTPTMVAQPVLAALLAIPLMGEKLLWFQSIGGIVTLLGIYLINVASIEKKKNDLSPTILSDL